MKAQTSELILAIDIKTSSLQTHFVCLNQSRLTDVGISGLEAWQMYESCACSYSTHAAIIPENHKKMKKLVLLFVFLSFFWSFHLEKVVSLSARQSQACGGAQVHLHFSLPASNYAQLHL